MKLFFKNRENKMMEVLKDLKIAFEKEKEKNKKLEIEKRLLVLEQKIDDMFKRIKKK